MNDKEKNYFTTKSFTFCIAIQFVTGKSYYKFTNEDNKIVYSFELDESEKEQFYDKLNKLQEIKFS